MPITRFSLRPVIAALAGWLIAALVVIPLCALAVLYLAGPHGGLLPPFLSPYVLGLGWLTVIVVPLVIARLAWRAARDRHTAGTGNGPGT